MSTATEIGGVLTLTASRWDEDVLSSPVPVAVSFWAEWCLPCRTVEPALTAAAREFRQRLRVGRVNGDEEPELLRRYAIRGLPTLLVLAGGREVARRVGLMTTGRLLSLLRQHA